MKERQVALLVRATEVSEGAGVKVRRSIGTPQLDHVDPFLLLDEFRSDDKDDYIAGFPDHPHRGFETVTYMLAGSMAHADHAGNKGLLGPGSIQWMTAGRGIVHSEMPRQQEGLMWGFQLWVNLPAKDKMCAPRYQEFPAGSIPEVRHGAALIRVIAGTIDGAEGPVKGIATAPLYLDVQIDAGGAVALPVTEGHNAFVYTFVGAGHVADTPVKVGDLALMTDGVTVVLDAGPEGARFLLVAAQPLGEPIARYGPFVMNTREEIVQAVRDFQAGRFGD